MSIQFRGTLTEQDFNRFQQYSLPTFCKWLFKWFPWLWLGFVLTRIYSGNYSIDQLVFDLFLLFYFFYFHQKLENDKSNECGKAANFCTKKHLGSSIQRVLFGEILMVRWDTLGKYYISIGNREIFLCFTWASIKQFYCHVVFSTLKKIGNSSES